MEQIDITGLPVYNFTFISYIAALTVSLAISLFFISYLWQRRNIAGAIPLMGVLAAIVFWSFGYIFEYTSNALDVKLFTWNISYIGIVTLPLMLLLFAAQYTRQDAWITPARLAVLLVIPAITIILQWTKDFHSLMYYNIHLVGDSPFLLVRKEYGAWFWIMTAYDYILLIIALLLLAARLFKPPRLLVDQVIYVIIGAAVPVIANVAYISNVLPIPHADFTPAAFAVSGVCLTLAITRHHFMDILPVARESAIELMQEGFLVMDDRQRMVDFNAAMQEIAGMTAQEMLGKPLPETISKQLYRDHSQNEKTEYKAEVALEIQQKAHYFTVTVSPLKVKYKHPGGHILIFHDFTERKLMEDAVKQIAYYDPLTGLPNRELFNDRAELALEEAGRYKRQLALLSMDIDKFKDINDSYGHDAGDQVLQDMAVRLSSAVRKIDTVCRLGGDEFLILLPEIASEQTANTVVQRIMESIARPFACNGDSRYVTISIGIAVYPEDALALNDLIKCSDIAMYFVKQNGRNGFNRYRADMAADGRTAPGAN